MSDLYTRLKQIKERGAAGGGAGGGGGTGADGAGGLPGSLRSPGPEWDEIAPGVYERRVSPGAREAPAEQFRRASADDGGPGADPYAFWDTLPDWLGSYRSLRPIFLDVETSGLSGGAGSTAFLIGIADKSSQVEVTQLFLSEAGSERAMLERFSELVGDPRDACFVTYNGASFDLPVLRGRHILNRLRFPEAAHWDLLHITRRLFSPVIGSCTLGRVESRVLGLGRDADIPGSEVPARYQAFLREGDPALIGDVVAHHAYDIAHLVDLSRRLTSILRGEERDGVSGDDSPTSAPDPLSLARLLLQRGRDDAGTVERVIRMLDKAIEETGNRRVAALSAARSRGLVRRLAGTVPRDWAVSRELRAVLARRRGDDMLCLRLRRELWEARKGRHDAIELAKVLEHRFRDYRGALDVLEELTAAEEESSDPALDHRRRRLLQRIARS